MHIYLRIILVSTFVNVGNQHYTLLYSVLPLKYKTIVFEVLKLTNSRLELETIGKEHSNLYAIICANLRINLLLTEKIAEVIKSYG